ncbi:MAG: hypothetical protein H6744_14665 [Deltaproteobacteria bacterium]|nr:hypothetical protein [Deltaproteobacteria bacterium]MCB9787924.1 hypothetical protein [Deltaproteobacteria bacterium]
MAAQTRADRYATASDDGIVRLWNSQGAQLGSVDARSGGIVALEFTADGRALVAAGADGALLRLDVQPLRLAGIIGNVEGGARTLALSPDGALVAAAGPARTVRIFDRASGELKAEVSPGLEVLSLAFSADGASLFGALGRAGLAVWQVADGAERGRYGAALGRIEHIAREREGDRLLWGGASQDGGARGGILSPDGQRELIGFTLPGARYVSALLWMPDGSALLADDLGLASIFAATDGLPRGRLALHAAPVAGLGVSPDGHHLLVRTDGGPPRVLTLTSEAQVALQRFDRAPTDLALSGDGRVLALGFKTSTLHLVDPTTGAPGPLLQLGPDPIVSLALSPDGSRVVIGARTGWVRVASTATGELEPDPLGRHEASVEQVAWSADGHTVASASIDGALRIWDMDQPHATREIATGTVLTGLELSADGSRVVAGTWSGARRVWETKGGTLVRDVASETPGERVLAIALGPDGHTLLSGGTHRPVRLRDLDHRADEAALMGQAGPVWAVAFAPNGQRVAAAGEDRVVRVWRAEDRKLEASLVGHLGTVVGLAFSPDGRTLYSISDDRTLRLWRLGR